VPTPKVTVADAAQAIEVVEGMARVRAEPGDEVEVVLRAADPLDRRVDLDVV
jgi:ribosomal protein L14